MELRSTDIEKFITIKDKLEMSIKKLPTDAEIDGFGQSKQVEDYKEILGKAEVILYKFNRDIEIYKLMMESKNRGIDILDLENRLINKLSLSQPFNKPNRKTFIENLVSEELSREKERK